MCTSELKDFFKRYGISHAEVARLMGYSVANVNGLLNGYRPLSSEQMRRLQEIQRDVLSRQVEVVSRDITRYMPKLAGNFAPLGAGR